MPPDDRTADQWVDLTRYVALRTEVPDDRTASQLRACAAIVECSGKPPAARLSTFLLALADRLDVAPPATDGTETGYPQVDWGAQHNDAPGALLGRSRSTGTSRHQTSKES